MGIFSLIVILGFVVYIGTATYYILYRRELKEGVLETRYDLGEFRILLGLCIVFLVAHYIFFKPYQLVDNESEIMMIAIEHHNSEGLIEEYERNGNTDLSELMGLMKEWKGERRLINRTRTELKPNIVIINMIIKSQRDYLRYYLVVEENSIMVAIEGKVYKVMKNENGKISTEALDIIRGYIESWSKISACNVI